MQHLDDLLSEHGDWDAVVAHLRAQGADEAGSAPSRAEAFRTLASLQERIHGDLAAAAESLEEATTLTPDDLGALAALADLYERAGDGRSAAAVLLDLADKTSATGDRASLLVRAAGHYGVAGEQESQRLILRRALEIDVPDVAVVEAVAAGWAGEGAAGELVDLLTEAVSRASSLADDARLVPVIVGAARAAQAAGRPERAEAYWSRAAALDAANEAVLAGLAASQEATGDAEGLADTLRRLAAAAIAGADEAAALRRLAAVLAQGDDLRGAVDALDRAWAADPRDADLDSIDALAARAGLVEPRLAVIERRLSVTDDASAKAELWLARAPLEAERGDRELSLRALRSALHYAPRNAAALRAVEDHLVADGDWAAVADHLERWADETVAPGARAQVLRRLARVQESLGEIAAAIASLNAVGEAEGRDVELVETIARLAPAAGQQMSLPALWIELADLADAGAATAASAADRRLAAAAALGDAGELAAAAAALDGLLARQPDHTEALRRLESVRRALGDAAGAASALKALAAAAPDDTARAAALRNAAAASESVDPADALDLWRQVAALEPDTADAADAIDRLLARTGDHASRVAHAEARASRSRDLGERAAILSRAAVIARDEVGDTARAVALFEQALEFDPAEPEAATALAAIEVERGAWPRAIELLRVVADAGAPALAFGGPFGVLVTLGRACAEVNDTAGARDAYERADGVAPGDLFVASRLTVSYALEGRFDDASRAFAFVDDRLHDLEPVERLEVLSELGRAAQTAGDSAAARRLFERALDVDPDDEPTLRALAAIDDDPARATEARQRLLQMTDDPLSRFKLLVEIGDGYAASDFPEGAIEAYTLALELDAASKVVLHKLLALHTARGAWEEAAAVVERLSDLETDPDRRKRYRFAVGAIYRDELADDARASAVFEQVLDADPDDPDALDAIEALHQRTGDVAALERAYRRMLRRLIEAADPDSAPLQFGVASRLGSLYAGPLANPTKALASYRFAAQLRPDHLGTRVAIAEIYPPGGKTDAQTVDEHRAIVALDPLREDSYHLLLGALRRERRVDEAWTVASILTVLGNRERLPTTFYADHRPASIVLAQRGLSRDEWATLQHPDMSPEATRLMAAIGAGLGRIFAGDIAAWGAHRRNDWIDTAQPGPVANTLHYAVQVLGAATPALYRWPGGADLRNGNTDPRSLLAGADILAAESDRRLVFRVVRAVCLLRDEFYLASAVDLSTMTAILQATLALFTGGPPPAWDSPAVRAWMAAIRDAPDAILEHLRGAVDTFLRAGQTPDLRAWQRAAELTAHRVALLLCGDLQRAAQASAALPATIGDVDAHARATEMIRFAASPAYATLRASLGLSVA